MRGALRDSTLSARLDYAYFPLGKVANTEVKRCMWEIDHARGYEAPVPERYFGVHNKAWRGKPIPTPWNAYQREGDLPRFLDDLRGRFIFSMVRNPYTRLLSGYLDKIVSIQKSETEALRDKRLRNYMLPAVPGDFGEFVDMICAQSDYQTNNHWKGQRYRIFYDFLPYGYLGHFEALEEVFGSLHARYGLAYTPREYKATHGTSKGLSQLERIRTHYTPELLDKVHARFRPDFEAFGYAQDPEEGFAPVRAPLPSNSLGAFTPKLSEMLIALDKEEILPADLEAAAARQAEVIAQAGEETPVFDPDLEIARKGERVQKAPLSDAERSALRTARQARKRAERAEEGQDRPSKVSS